MTIVDATLLGALQGLTEFLPISSSGHLILMEKVLNLPFEYLKSFDIAVHFGTLLAIVAYFRKTIWDLAKAFFVTPWKFLTQGKKAHFSDEIRKNQQLLGQLILASIPAFIIGVTLSDWLDERFRNPFSVAIFFVIVGILFFVAEYIFKKVKKQPRGLVQSVLMGFAQCLALIPGISRSGITISAGLVQGVEREEAARFSFLLGAVAIFGGAVFAIVAVLKGKYALPNLDVLIIGILSSFIVGLAAISFLMKFLKKHTLHVFGVYRILIGLTILGLSLYNFLTLTPIR